MLERRCCGLGEPPAVLAWLGRCFRAAPHAHVHGWIEHEKRIRNLKFVHMWLFRGSSLLLLGPLLQCGAPRGGEKRKCDAECSLLYVDVCCLPCGVRGGRWMTTANFEFEFACVLLWLYDMKSICIYSCVHVVIYSVLSSLSEVYLYTYSVCMYIRSIYIPQTRSRTEHTRKSSADQSQRFNF